MNKDSAHQVYALDGDGISGILNELDKWTRKAGVGKDAGLHMHLAAEELLLRMKDRLGEEGKCLVSVKRRIGGSVFLILNRGERFDPLEKAEKTDGHDIVASLLPHLVSVPRYSYRSGFNEISFKAPSRNIRSEVLLISAALLAVLAWLIGKSIPAGAKDIAASYVLTPVSSMFMNALNTFVGVMIFLSVISGICSIGSLSDFSRMGKYVISRMILNTTVGVTFATVVLIPFYDLTYGTVEGGAGSFFESMRDLLVGIVPSDPVTPFATGNMLQIIFMAVLTGSSILIIGSPAERLRQAASDLSGLMIQILSAVCRFLPLYIFCSLTLFFWTQGGSVVLKLWKPVVLLAAVCLILFIISAVITSVRTKTPVTYLVRSVFPSMLGGLLTASTTANLSRMTEINTQKFRIKPEFNSFALPFSSLLLSSCSGTALVVIVYFIAQYAGIPVNPGWFFTVWLGCVILGMAMPPVSGGLLVSVGIIMTQFEIPSGALAIAGVLSIVCDFIMTSARLGVAHCSIYSYAHHLGMLKEEAPEITPEIAGK